MVSEVLKPYGPQASKSGAFLLEIATDHVNWGKVLDAKRDRGLDLPPPLPPLPPDPEPPEPVTYCQSMLIVLR